MATDNAEGKRSWHPTVRCCGGCGLGVVIAVGLMAFALQRYGVGTGSGEPVRVIERVRGGVVRSYPIRVKREVLSTDGLGFRTRETVTFCPREVLGLSGLLEVWAYVRRGPWRAGNEWEDADGRGVFDQVAVRQCDLQSGALTTVMTRLQPDRCVDGEEHSWSPDGTRAVLSGIRLRCSAGEAEEVRDVLPSVGANMLCIFTPGTDGGDWQELTEGHNPCWSADGNRIFFQRGHWDDQSFHCIRPDGTDERRLNEGRGTLLLDDAPEGGTLKRVHFLAEIDDTEAFPPFELLHIPLDGGDATSVAIRDVGLREGPLTEHEYLVTDPPRLRRSDTDPRGPVAALDLETGQMRRLRDDLPGAWHPVRVIADGRGVVVRGTVHPKVEGYERFPDGSYSGSGVWAVFSLIDGKLRRLCAKTDDVAFTDDLTRMAWVEGATEAEPWQDQDYELKVLDLIYPEELLTGPADAEPGQAQSGDIPQGP